VNIPVRLATSPAMPAAPSTSLSQVGLACRLIIFCLYYAVERQSQTLPLVGTVIPSPHSILHPNQVFWIRPCVPRNSSRIYSAEKCVGRGLCRILRASTSSKRGRCVLNYREGGRESGRESGRRAGGGGDGGDEAVQAMSTTRTLRMYRHPGLAGEGRRGRRAGHSP